MSSQFNAYSGYSDYEPSCASQGYNSARSGPAEESEQHLALASASLHQLAALLCDIQPSPECSPRFYGRTEEQEPEAFQTAPVGIGCFVTPAAPQSECGSAAPCDDDVDREEIVHQQVEWQQRDKQLQCKIEPDSSVGQQTLTLPLDTISSATTTGMFSLSDSLALSSPSACVHEAEEESGFSCLDEALRSGVPPLRLPSKSSTSSQGDADGYIDHFASASKNMQQMLRTLQDAMMDVSSDDEDIDQKAYQKQPSAPLAYQQPSAPVKRETARPMPWPWDVQAIDEGDRAAGGPAPLRHSPEAPRKSPVPSIGPLAPRGQRPQSAFPAPGARKAEPQKVHRPMSAPSDDMRRSLRQSLVTYLREGSLPDVLFEEDTR
eukprot:TRINITY_DN40116_c0_g1_i1.p1 TRINITY_DN40116_c0_g1~~TRINITY_DN40116_c0_g1_i1.p1  ORF type:complete len:377 (+),score=68.39 TRINITY_DN40116_c0_g1_i1:101-1231(+)